MILPSHSRPTGYRTRARRWCVMRVAVGASCALLGLTGCGSDDAPPAESSATTVSRKAPAADEMTRRQGKSPTETGASRNRRRPVSPRASALPQPGQRLEQLSTAQQRALLELARRAQRVPATRAAGCDRFRLRGVATPQVGPPPAHISARRVGERVQIRYRLRKLPRSLACRPFAVVLRVRSRTKGSTPSGSSYVIQGKRGIELVESPREPPPWIAQATTLTVNGRASRAVVARVSH